MNNVFPKNHKFPKFWPNLVHFHSLKKKKKKEKKNKERKKGFGHSGGP